MHLHRLIPCRDSLQDDVADTHAWRYPDKGIVETMAYGSAHRGVAGALFWYGHLATSI